MGRRRRPQFDASSFDNIVHGVKTIYREKVRPLEEQYMVKEFFYPLLSDADFDYHDYAAQRWRCFCTYKQWALTPFLGSLV